MKKMIFVLIASLAFIGAKAQPGTTVHVINQLTCDIAINVVAVCPDCNEYSSVAMNPVPGPISWPGYQYYPGVSWSTPDPETECPGEWKWAYAIIQFFCEDGGSYYAYVGNPNAPCHTYNAVDGILIPQDCADACHGGNTLLQASWTTIQPSGDVQIIIW